MNSELGERQGRRASRMGQDGGAGLEDSFKNYKPRFRDSRNGKQRFVGALKTRHLMRVTQAAILAGPVLVPMHEDNGQAQQHQNRNGASKQRLPAPDHNSLS